MDAHGQDMDLKGGAVLFSEMTPGPAFEAEFNAWYDEERIPLRTACRGFVSACRYKAADAPNYLAVYDLGDIGVLGSDAYRAIKDNPSERTAWMLGQVAGLMRYLGRETSCRAQSAPAIMPLDVSDRGERSSQSYQPLAKAKGGLGELHRQ